MARLTKAERQEIVREFAIRHNGRYDAALFMREVEETGLSHPAYGWFEWDDNAAVRQYRLWQAREFANDLRVVFTVEEVGRDSRIIVREREAPLVLSPMDGRSEGGGYYLTDPDNPDHMAELCRQAATSLTTWLRRYGAAVQHAGGSIKKIEHQIRQLRSMVESPEDVAT